MLAQKDLEKLGKAESPRIIRKVQSHLVHNPLSLGKPLSCKFKGLYRYRIGDYRVIYEIYRQELIITVVHVGHRRDVYD